MLLADDMGLGKTAQAIAACHALWRSGRVRRGLVVVPAALKPQWLREWHLFERPTETTFRGLSTPKLLELRELIGQIAVAQGRKVVVFSQWRRMLRLAHWATRDELARDSVRAAFFTGDEGQKRQRALTVRTRLRLSHAPALRSAARAHAVQRRGRLAQR